MYTIVGLGNPGHEYAQTRHNAGRMALELARTKFDLPEWEADKKTKALVSAGKVVGEKMTLVMPETFMNKSGESVVKFVKSKKAAEQLIVVYDDLDLPLGGMKISFNRSSGGHRGLESIIRSLKTEAFVRIRIGICPVTPAGKLKKPHGDDEVADFIIGKFRAAELDKVKKVLAKVPEAIETIMKDGHERAMGEFNQ